MKRVVFKTNEAVAYQGEAMESGDHFNNGASSKSQRSRENNVSESASMKKILISLIVVLATMTTFAQTQTNTISTVSPDNDIVYRIFPTQNRWTFIKLNTRNGQMWQVQYDVGGNNRHENILSLITRVSSENEANGRFFLYPTQNMYNFILLDQVDGRVWQVQWSDKSNERMVISIN